YPFDDITCAMAFLSIPVPRLSVRQVARELSVTPAQLALAWLLHQGRDIIPIPGTRRPERVSENADASAIKLDGATLQRTDDLARPGLARGATLV
ncbi:MAG: aldo/keto reductase, partial [Sulfuritalea sp.]|nr:aldo/keto reductase [Sulfuritalea sp.]